jgi:hypothetical protein
VGGLIVGLMFDWNLRRLAYRQNRTAGRPSGATSTRSPAPPPTALVCRR